MGQGGDVKMERFEEVFKAAIQSMHEVNVKAYGSLMANVMLPGLEALKPVFKATYDQGVKDEQEKLEGCVVVPLENARYFSNDGENYEIHETLEQAKHEAECAIEHYSERLADQLMDPTSDGNFQQIGYGVILAESSYSINHVVTQDDIDNGDYSYEVGTQIMTLSLVEAARGGNHE